jgi:hypothetical protein
VISARYLLLILAQAAHSIEEYVAKRLDDVFAPARLVSGLVSDDLAFEFAVPNAAIVTIVFWCWAVPVRCNWPVAFAVMESWVLLELANGSGHVLFSIDRGGYFPGVLTASLLLLVGGRLAYLLVTLN